MEPVRGAPYHPQAQSETERWRQTLKARILLENLFLPGELERWVAAFIEPYNHARYHESLDNVAPTDVNFGRAEIIVLERKKIKCWTIADRRVNIN